MALKDKLDDGNKIQPPNQIISSEYALEMAQAYKNEMLPLLRQHEAEKSGEHIHPTESIWYDFNTIKQYIAYLEQEASEASVAISGLRIYFSKYPTSGNFKDGKKANYSKRNSIFMVPTMHLDDKDCGFTVSKADNGNKTAVLLKDKVSQIQNRKAGDSGSGDEGKGTILNDGTLIPPPQQEDPIDGF